MDMKKVRVGIAPDDLKIGEWTTETLDIFENITIRSDHYDLEIRPNSIEIEALSASWQVTSDDIIFVSYTSTFDFELNNSFFTNSAAFKSIIETTSGSYLFACSTNNSPFL